MVANERYAVTLPGQFGAHSPPQVLIVYPTDDLGADGRRIWTDDTGQFQVEIAGEVATVLVAPAGFDRHPCLHAVALV